MKIHSIAVFVLAVWSLCVAAGSLHAQEFIPVDLEFRPELQTAQVGQTISLDLWAIAQVPPGQRVSSLSVVLTWDPQKLRLIDRVIPPPNPPTTYGWLVSNFPTRATFDTDGLNDTWLDGNAFYVALGQIPPIPLPIVRDTGLWVVTFRFELLRPTASAFIVMAPTLGDNSETVVFDGNIPNHPVTGDLFSAEVRPVDPDGGFGDFDMDGDVDQADVAAFQSCFTGEIATYTESDCTPGDYNRDGHVDQDDFALFADDLNGPQ